VAKSQAAQKMKRQAVYLELGLGFGTLYLASAKWWVALGLFWILAIMMCGMPSSRVPYVM